jgi:hypothetical protein
MLFFLWQTCGWVGTCDIVFGGMHIRLPAILMLRYRGFDLQPNNGNGNAFVEQTT